MILSPSSLAKVPSSHNFTPNTNESDQAPSSIKSKKRSKTSSVDKNKGKHSRNGGFSRIEEENEIS
jgi:hypothetical protein